MRTRVSGWIFVTCLVVLGGLLGCGDDGVPARGRIGDACRDDAQCGTGMLCIGFVCQDEDTFVPDPNPEPIVDACTPGERRCADRDTALICGEDGRDWSGAIRCDADELCSDGRCISDVPDCNPGESRCAGNEIQLCDGDNWATSEICDADQYCQGAVCRDVSTCDEGASVCLDDWTVQSCVNGRWVTGECVSGSCVAGTCEGGPTCNPGETRCLGSQWQVCEGSWITAQTCGGGEQCTTRNGCIDNQGETNVWLDGYIYPGPYRPGAYVEMELWGVAENIPFETEMYCTAWVGGNPGVGEDAALVGEQWMFLGPGSSDFGLWVDVFTEPWFNRQYLTIECNTWEQTFEEISLDDNYFWSERLQVGNDDGCVDDPLVGETYLGRGRFEYFSEHAICGDYDAFFFEVTEDNSEFFFFLEAFEAEAFILFGRIEGEEIVETYVESQSSFADWGGSLERGTYVILIAEAQTQYYLEAFLEGGEGGLPNLIPAEGYVEQQTDEGAGIYAVVYNESEVLSPATTLSVWAESPEFGQIQVGEYPVPALSRFDAYEFFEFFPIPPLPTDLDVYITVDPNNRVAESNEQDNTLFVGTYFGTSVCADDANEPNDRRSQATNVGPGIVYSANICEDDVDYYVACTGGATERFTFQIEGSRGDLDVRMTNGNGQEIDGGFSASSNERLDTRVGPEQCYYYEVFNFSPEGGVDYLVTFDRRVVDLQCSGLFEPNDTFDQASSGPEALDFELDLCGRGDIDIFAFETVPGARYVAGAFASDRVAVRVTSSNGSVLASGSGTSPVSVFVADSPVVYLQVDSQSGEDVNYELVFNEN